MVDYNFFIKYLVRFIINHKLNILNTYDKIFIKKIIFFFQVSKLEDFDDIQGYNYCYLFKYFFGRSCFLTKIRERYHLAN